MKSKRIYLVFLVVTLIFAGCAGHRQVVRNDSPKAAVAPAASQQDLRAYQEARDWAKKRSGGAPIVVKKLRNENAQVQAKAQPGPPPSPVAVNKPAPTPPVARQPVLPPAGNYVTQVQFSKLQNRVEQNSGAISSLEMRTAALERYSRAMDARLGNFYLIPGVRNIIRIGNFRGGQVRLTAKLLIQVKASVRRINQLAATRKSLTLDIFGFASKAGSESLNIKLSGSRATAVARAMRPLLAKNVHIYRVRGVGESDGCVYPTNNQCVRIIIYNS